jgi:hypothetical protein
MIIGFSKTNLIHGINFGVGYETKFRQNSARTFSSETLRSVWYYLHVVCLLDAKFNANLFKKTQSKAVLLLFFMERR